ncbi:amidohydrolase/deacetylase family metallohydrolase [Candidatus Latescibacterota bacterium]
MKTVRFITVFVLLSLFLQMFIGIGLSQESDPSTILLKGGHVIDPANNINKIMDVLVDKGKIAHVAENIPESEAQKVVDVSGYYVSPGFIDLHAHFYHTDEIHGPSWVSPDSYGFQYGVTTIVDAGSSGAETFEHFKESVIDVSLVRTLAFLNISKKGMSKREYENDPYLFDAKLAAKTAKMYPEIIIGFKTAHYDAGNYDGVRIPWISLDRVIEAGTLADLPCMLDFHPAPPMDGYPERSFRDIILKKMRPGDIYTHCYYPHFPTVDDNFKVNPDVLKAQESGVYFDVGHGGGSFVFRIAVPAIKQGFWANSISTDAHRSSSMGPMLNMTNVMSKILVIGIPLKEVIRRSTINPALEIKRPELGHLSVGAVADVSVFKLEKGKFIYTDVRGGKFIGDRNIRNFMTLFEGRIVFDPYGLSSTVWDKIPKDDEYWVIINKQRW